MAYDMTALEPAYSNLIDHFDQAGVRVPVRTIANCIRFARQLGISDPVLESTFIACVEQSGSQFNTEDAKLALETRFREEVQKSK